MSAAERLYLKEDAALGIVGPEISDQDIARHKMRYLRVSVFAAEACGFNHLHTLYDVGCGSGYGTEMLANDFQDSAVTIRGIEPDLPTLNYANKHHGGSPGRFRESMPTPDQGERVCLAFVEVIEHLTDGELDAYLATKNVKSVIVTTPIVPQDSNPHHKSPYTSADSVKKALEKRGFRETISMLERDIEFTSGDLGDQFYGVYVRD